MLRAARFHSRQRKEPVSSDLRHPQPSKEALLNVITVSVNDRQEIWVSRLSCGLLLYLLLLLSNFNL
jgi:hypothetical protein